MTKKTLTALFILVAIVIGGWFVYPHTKGNTRHSADKLDAKTAEDFRVIRVVDGDTIIVALNHKPETVRLLGINTPETVAPNRPVQCYGPEASNRTKELLKGKIVRLDADPSQDNEDKYHRLLRFVFLGNENVNESLVRDGYAREYTYKHPYAYQAEFRAKQKAAKKNKLGLWGACPTK